MTQLYEVEDTKNSQGLQFLGSYACLETKLVDLLEDCYIELGENIQTQASFGRLLGRDNGTPIELPILTDTFLQPSSCYTFDQHFGQQITEAVIYSILGESRDHWTVQGNGEKAILEFVFSDPNLVGLCISNEVTLHEDSTCSSEDPSIQNAKDSNGREEEKKKGPLFTKELIQATTHYVQLCHLGKLIWFLPKSDIHVQITCTSQKKLPTPPSMEGKNGIEILQCRRRKITSWDFHPMNHQGPSWNLSLCETQEAMKTFPYSLKKKESVFSVNLRPHWPAQQPLTHGTFSDFPVRAIIERICLEFLVQCRDLASHLDAELGKRMDFTMTPKEYFYPGYFGDIVSETRRHYDVKKIKAAKYSDIEALRRLNNEVKRVLIEKYVSEQTKVLDLACGHGQDMLKYAQRNILHYVGIDFSKEEIKEARRRLERFKRDTRQENASKGAWEFFQGNLADDVSLKHLGDALFDTVSIQLAIHYLLSSEQSAHSFFHNVSSHLKFSGFFLGSTGHSEFIAERLTHMIIQQAESSDLVHGHTCVPSGSYTMGNSLYHLEISSETLMSFWTTELGQSLTRVAQLHQSGVTHEAPEYQHTAKSFQTMFKQKLLRTWGIKYKFYLKDHIDAVEYFIPWDAFCDLCQQHGLCLIEYKPFHEFLAYEIETNSRLQRWIETSLSQLAMNDEELDAFKFYCIFSFVKKPFNPVDETSETLHTTFIEEGQDINSSSDTSTTHELSDTAFVTQKSFEKDKRETTQSVLDSFNGVTNHLSLETQQPNSFEVLDPPACLETTSPLCTTPPLHLNFLSTPPPTVHDKDGNLPQEENNHDDVWSTSSSASSSLSSSPSSSSSSSTSSFPNFKPSKMNLSKKTRL